jgi:hypothetical protein
MGTENFQMRIQAGGITESIFLLGTHEIRKGNLATKERKARKKGNEDWSD